MNSVKTLGLIIALVVSAFSVNAFAAKQTVKKKQQKQVATKKSKKAPKKVAKESGSANLQTDINFNDSVLHGRYQTPDEATAKVENEKSLSDLLAVRTQFKDRLKKSSEQN